jgi:hypothetical protein
VNSTARTPEEAVEFLARTGPDVKAAIVLGEAGELAAHSEGPGRESALRELVTNLFERAGTAAGGRVDQLEISTGAGTVFAMRRRRFSIAVVTGRLALSSLVMFDLRMVLIDLEAATS